MTSVQTPLTARRSGPLTGRIAVPGDKSISHRALMFGALAVGRTTVSGLLEGEDVLSTAAAVAALGATVTRTGPGAWSIDGVGIGGLVEPDRVLDMGNSGTAARLLIGLVSTHPITTFFTGDSSLVRRPMQRVTVPLERMGAGFITRAGRMMPLVVQGCEAPVPIEYRLPVASAQVKSAVLLAGLNTPGRTSVIEPAATRDHSERMLRAFGAEVTVEELGDGARRVTVTGQPELTPAVIEVPGDPSSAAFPLVAALLTPGSEVTIEGVGLNPLRTGLLDTLIEMGAAIEIRNPRLAGDEPVGDLYVRAGILRGIAVPAERAPRMIDEYPILAVAAACAEGTTVLHGLEELKVKESDRLAAVAGGLAACGVAVTVEDATLTIQGLGGPPPGGARIAARLDHRIAMAFLVMGMVARAPVEIDDGATIETSFPGFVDLMNGLGASIGTP
ncbi:MAG TPA: 3-phosphoshikimate 1-carboxyvinyltransferase [Stellaceae bacterium]|nr:3-phosphoshikimate 1-carboxyvinyltransferase [Stellaceae bacterium]